MTTLKLSPNASGAGSFTIAAPSTSSDFTLNLPSTLGTNNGSALVSTDASGNLGLGVTPRSGWNSGFKAMEFSGGYGAISGQTAGAGVFGFSWGAYATGVGTWAYSTTGDIPNLFTMNSGLFKWYTAGSGTAGNAISFTQAMTLDASGNLGVATTSPSTYGKLAVRAGITVNAGTTSLTGTSFFASDAANSSFWISHSSANTNLVSDSPLTFWGPSGSGVAERARIDSSGNLLVGTTGTISGFFGSKLQLAAGDNNGINIQTTTTASNSGANIWNATDSGTRTFINFYTHTSRAFRGSISSDGTTTSYNTTSDYRLKENIQPMTGALAKVAALKPCTYNWKADGSDGEGFIAHELAEVAPQCVTGEKDAVDEDGNPQYQGIDTSFLVATLTAAIQEQQAIINAQSAALEQLKAQLTSVSADVAALKGAK